MIVDPAMQKLISELRDACETALDFWSDPGIRDRQILEAAEAAQLLLGRVPPPGGAPAEPRSFT